MRKIAIPIDENGILSQHTGHSKLFDIYNIEEDKIIDVIQLTPPPHKYGSLPKWLIENKVTDLIVGGIGQKAIELLDNDGIKVHLGAPSLASSKLITDFLDGTLQFSANSCNH